jgi:hypothetical protein
MSGRRVTPEVFWSYINKTDECWNWLGCVDRNTGYGKLSFNGRKNSSPHRVAYELTFGIIPIGMWVLHKCDNRICCNPSHLFLGTSEDNINDMLNKGRNPIGEKVGTSKLTKEEVVSIKEMLGDGMKHIDIARMFGVKKVTISAIATKRNWAWV